MNEITLNRKLAISCYDKNGKAKYGQVGKNAKTFGKHRKTIWKYNKRLKESNGDEASLLPRKRGPKNGKNRIAKHIERTIVAMHRKLGWKGTKIHAELKSRGFINPKTNKAISKPTIYLVLGRYPTYEKTFKEKSQRYEKLLPGELGHVDLKKAKNIKGEDPKKKKYYSQLLDDCTRITYVELIPDKKAKTLAEFIKRATKWFREKHQIDFEAILSDNGKEYTWHTKKGKENHSFEKTLKSLNIKHKYTKIRRPQTNGKAERFWRIIDEEFASAYQFNSWQEFNIYMKKWLYKYNHFRKHGGIGYQTPKAKYLSLFPIYQNKKHIKSLYQEIVTEIV